MGFFLFLNCSSAHSYARELLSSQTGEITGITGITNSMVSNSPSIESVFDDFLNFIDNHIIVAHNISFDIGFIEEYANRYAKIINIRDLCDTLLLSRSFLFFLDKFNLEYLSSEFGFNNENAHRARIDALNTGKLFQLRVFQILKNKFV